MEHEIISLYKGCIAKQCNPHLLKEKLEDVSNNPNDLSHVRRVLQHVKYLSKLGKYEESMKICEELENVYNIDGLYRKLEL